MQTLLIAPKSQNSTAVKVDSLIRGRYGFRDPEVASLEQAESQFVKTCPGLVIVILTVEQLERILDVIRRLRSIGALSLLVVGPATDPKIILRAMQFGADLFLDQAELEPQLESALTRLNAKRSPRKQLGHLLAVLSTAGGCGASTLAVNLAAILARESGRCNLIDLNPGKADLGPLLDLKPQFTIADLCRNHDRLDRSMYEKLLTHHPSGIRLLAAPREFEQVRSVTARGIAQAIALARESYAHVIVDLEDCFHAEQSLVLEQTSRILLICRLDFTSIRSTRQILDYLTARSIPRDRIEVVVNHFGLPNELPIPEAESAIGGKLEHFIAHDPASICEANNTGIPVAIKDPGSAIAQSIASLVHLDSPARAASPPLSRFNLWLRGSVGPRLRKTLNCLSRSQSALDAPAKPQELQDTHESISIPQPDTESGSWPARFVTPEAGRVG